MRPWLWTHLLDKLNQKDLNFTSAVILHDFDGRPGYSDVQGG